MYYIDDFGTIYDSLGVIAQDNNPHHLAYLAWLEEGNTPEEWNPNAIE